MQSDKTLANRGGFATKLGIIAAAAGTAIGLGNIWRFPYITGQGGGAAFIIVYAVFILFIGMSCMLVEFIIGRRSRRDAIGSFTKLAPGTPWFIGGVIGVISIVLIYSFYVVVFGWTLDYLLKAISASFVGRNPTEIATMFGETTSSMLSPLFFSFLAIFLTSLIIAAGVEKGIEKYTKLLLPILFCLLIVLAIRAVTLPGSMKGLEFLFKPDFSKLTGETLLIALGQAFFTLSLGVGNIITYGSYVKKSDGLGSTVFYTCLLNSTVSILAAIVIFSSAFAFNIAPDAGPPLIFITLPNVFEHMIGGYFFAIMFFVLMSIAALTSTIGMMETIVAAVTDGLKITRRKATIYVAILIAITCIPCSLSYGTMADFKILGKNMFDLFDYISANYGMPIASLIFAMFVGWYLGPKIIKEEITNSGAIKAKYANVFIFIIRYVVPVAIVFVLIAKFKGLA